MTIIDLTHNLHNEMPIFPGSASPSFTKKNTIETNGYNESEFRFFSHNGTHIDAPSHMISNGKSLDEFDVSMFIGRAIMINIDPDNKRITRKYLEKFEQELYDAEFVVFNTSWHTKWGSNEYFYDFPCLTETASQFLTTLNLKGIGLDTISLDTMDSTDYANHLIVLGAGMLIIENLANLSSIRQQKFELSVLPIKYYKADGSPVRAIAQLPE